MAEDQTSSYTAGNVRVLPCFLYRPTKMPCPLPHDHYCCLLPSLICSPAHLHMPHLFTHCLLTIICIMLMYIAFFYFLFLLHATFLCDSILACLCTYFLFCILSAIFPVGVSSSHSSNNSLHYHIANKWILKKIDKTCYTVVLSVSIMMLILHM